MPIADDPDARPAGEPDPFDGLVLDEDFVRAATVKEQSGRARMLAAKWKREPPVAVPQHGNPGTPPPRRTRTRTLRERLSGTWKPVLIVLAVCGMALLGLKLGDSPKPAPAPQPAVSAVTPSSPSGSAPPDSTPSSSPTPQPIVF